jgi:hypothetical protein
MYLQWRRIPAILSLRHWAGNQRSDTTCCHCWAPKPKCVKNSGAGADGDNGRGMDVGDAGCASIRECAGELDNIIISSSLGHVGGQNQCIMYLDNIIITVRNVSMSVKEI